MATTFTATYSEADDEKVIPFAVHYGFKSDENDVDNFKKAKAFINDDIKKYFAKYIAAPKDKYLEKQSDIELNQSKETSLNNTISIIEVQIETI